MTNGLRAEEKALQIDIYDLVKNGFVQFVLMSFVHQQARNIDAGVVYKHIYAPKGVHHFFDHGVHTFFFGDIGLHIEQFSVSDLQFGGFVADVTDSDIGTVRQKFFNGGQPDAGCAARDNNRFAFQIQPGFHNMIPSFMRLSFDIFIIHFFRKKSRAYFEFRENCSLVWRG